MASADTIIQKALSYEGEGGSRFQNAFGMNDSWCVVFVWYVFRECGVSNLFCGGQKIASVGTVMNYYKNIGKFGSTPQKGALALFDWHDGGRTDDHIGIVISSSGNTIHTIEGNTYGGVVAQRDRSVSNVIGYCYPAYSSPAPSGQWIQAADGRWWYRHSDGSYKKNDWEFINGEWYYFDAEGWMKTGWIPWKGLWYYCDSSGKMLTNCWVENKYYVGNTGAMLVSTMTPDGYTVVENGEWDGREKWVTRLQRALKAAGYNPGTIDGEAGANTLNACPTLQYNSQGAIVSLVQEKLANYFHIGVAGGIDGSFGEGTESAVKELQRQYHLDMDGVVGRATWTVLLQL